MALANFVIGTIMENNTASLGPKDIIITHNCQISGNFYTEGPQACRCQSQQQALQRRLN